MLEFLQNYGGTIFVALVVAGIVTAIIINLIKNKKKGRSSCSCGCGCQGCASQSICHGEADPEE
jgi:hypothetical protein